ncbi:saccharopine dehydrogenase family protein [Pseudomonas sp. N040]|uniref:saccharopine dehydrogenase family protein n=1 Tax=Pseudomonas sp. N040 TaxID=2785325 RepID=UPI0018A30014|nr:saccharopine dehydrogenase NADP-binding domain-containing protein [Pseudomonas sp. N040]MBF7730712.1 saccharopine dehydrogenase NADP-binding domain-containing protein [Pseudomonas sp. N040]MBW7014355.1 saccharopine dehydrogenase NADP-binding domain-containing protein [Pseudomonas sp. N040]
MANHHLVVYGASSFVGQLLTHYLFDRHGVDGDLDWAIAGRSRAKLEQLRTSLGPAAAGLPIMVADAADEKALRSLCRQTRVVASTVGPYALYGSTLVKVCAQTGTDYCDLTGEPQWIAQMIREHEAAAQKSGARIVHCSGFDSVPSDLGTYYLQQQALKQYGQSCTRVKLRVKAMRGGASGGTVASMLETIRESVANPALRKLLNNPYAFCTADSSGLPRQPNPQFASFDEDAKAWSAPFIMAVINTKVVHRSNQLSGYAYGHDFVYDEAMLTGQGLAGRASAIGIALGLAAFTGAVAMKPTRALLERFVLPKPGEGPTPEQQKVGFYDIRLLGRTSTGNRLTVKVTGDRDPGYGSTCKILGEAAVCLAQDIAKADKPGGFWTPATLLGDALLARLTEHAGLTFSVVE